MPQQSSFGECTMITIEYEDSPTGENSSKIEEPLQSEISYDSDDEEEQEDLWYVYCNDEDLDELASLSSVSLISEDGIEILDNDELDPFPYHKEQTVCEDAISYRGEDRSTTSMVSISIDSVQLPSQDGTQMSQNKTFLTKKDLIIDFF